jgi:hypothetical protein
MIARVSIPEIPATCCFLSHLGTDFAAPRWLGFSAQEATTRPATLMSVDSRGGKRDRDDRSL